MNLFSIGWLPLLIWHWNASLCKKQWRRNIRSYCTDHTTWDPGMWSVHWFENCM